MVNNTLKISSLGRFVDFDKLPGSPVQNLCKISAFLGNMQTNVIFCYIFFAKNLCISVIFCNFAPDFKKTILSTIKLQLNYEMD